MAFGREMMALLTKRGLQEILNSQIPKSRDPNPLPRTPGPAAKLINRIQVEFGEIEHPKPNFPTKKNILHSKLQQHLSMTISCTSFKFSRY